jgi:hypothetical protein
MRDTCKIASLTAGFLSFLVFINSAAANTIFAPNPPTITFIDANHHRWDYDVIVSQGSEVRSGDGFTIYDFAGFRGVGSALPAGWTLNASQTNAPDYPFETRASTDNAAITDLILSYSGPTTGNADANTELGTFSFISAFNLRANSFFESSDHTIFNGVAQTDNHNTQVPTGVPEPAAMWVMGVVGVMLRRRRTGN